MLPTNDILARDRVPVRTRAEDIADERNRRQNVVRFGAMLCIMLTLFDGSQNARMAAIQQQQQRGQTQGRGGSGTETGSQGQHIPPAALDPKFLGHVNFITSTASSAPLSSSFSSQAQMDQYRGYSGADSTGTNPNLSQVIAQERSATNATGIYHGTWDSPNSFLQAGLVGLEKAASPAPSQAHPDGSAAKATSDGRLLQDIETKDYISHSKLSSTSIDANKSSRGPLFLQLRASPLPGLLHVSFLFGLVTLGKAGPQMQDLLVPVQG